MKQIGRIDEKINGLVGYNAHATEYKNTFAQHLGRILKKDIGERKRSNY